MCSTNCFTVETLYSGQYGSVLNADVSLVAMSVHVHTKCLVILGLHKNSTLVIHKLCEGV